MTGLQADDSVDEEVLGGYCWMYSTFHTAAEYKVQI